MERIEAELQRRREQGALAGMEETEGFHLELESPPGFLLKLESVEYRRIGIELCAARRAEGREFAVVFVPTGKLSFFVKRIEAYIRSDPAGKAKNRALVESIAEMRLAVVESFWTDPPEEMPDRNVVVWMEAWLRGASDEISTKFGRVARAAEIEVAEERQSFPDRTVVLVRTSLNKLSKHLEILEMLAELRRVKQIGSFFSRLDRQERQELTEHLLDRIQFPASPGVAVTVLDSGVYRAHPLLAPLLPSSALHTGKPSWKVHDHHGHGTEMAGIAAYGDLATAALSSGPIVLSHRLESVKILPPVGKNPQHLYGRVTRDGVSLVEIEAPELERVFSLAVTTDASDRGVPTAWSAEIDKLSSGIEDEDRRLFLVSAGNIQIDAGRDYPHRNYTECVQDPGQSWNALTVGAYTELIELDEPHHSGWKCIAAPGCLAPMSTTSIAWDPRWPIKPDIVMEGGNMAIAPAGSDVDTPDSLSLLTTYFRSDRPFTSTGDTSAATAAAARFAAIIRSSYPSLWPETVRALLVDSAEWTVPMVRELDAAKTAEARAASLRSFGFGVPDLERALWSAGSSLTMIAQDELQPFTGDKSKEMNLHKLPWPKAQLESLGVSEHARRGAASGFCAGWVMG